LPPDKVALPVVLLSGWLLSAEWLMLHLLLLPVSLVLLLVASLETPLHVLVLLSL
jgi:hypothetical protein